jgi:transcriptional regulator with XRE-family HTH domain
VKRGKKNLPFESVLGTRLATLRGELGLTAEEVARRAQMSSATLSRLEAGRDASLRTVLRVCDVLGVTLLDLWEGDHADLPVDPDPVPLDAVSDADGVFCDGGED